MTCWAGVVAVALLTAPPALAEEPSAFAQALAAYQDRRLDEALRYARDAVHRGPDHVEARLLLGELYYLRQDLTSAQEQWERALRLAPSRQDVRERLEQLQREARVEQALTRSDTYPFVVRFAEGETPLDLGGLRGLLRETYRLVGQQFQYFPDHPIPVILYPQAAFEQVRGVSHQVAGLYDGKIRLPVQPGRRTGRELQRVLWHEYTHAVVHDLAKGRCPLWLNEGIATLQEARVQPPDLTPVREALRAGGVLPWTQLWGEQQYEVAALPLRYGQAYLIARYLVKLRGWTQLVSLLTRLGQETPLEEALRVAYQTDPGRLEAEWLAWVKRELR